MSAEDFISRHVEVIEGTHNAEALFALMGARGAYRPGAVELNLRACRRLIKQGANSLRMIS